MQPPIPVTVLGGYLGAGKTTLVNHILRQADGRRLAILVNEFGALPIDEDLIESRNGNVLALSGGCVCCSFGSDLIGALMDLRRQVPRPDHVVIETSGVALPGSVAQSLTLLAGFTLDAIVVLADAETLSALAADRYLSDTITRQLADADLVLLNKTDIATQPELAASRAVVAGLAPGARLVETQHAAMSIDILLGQGGSNLSHDADAAPHDSGLHDSISLTLNDPVDAQSLIASLTAVESGVLRSKGFVSDGDGHFHSIQTVGRRGSLARVAQDRKARLVVIGLRGQLDPAAVAAMIETSTIKNRNDEDNAHGHHHIRRDFAG